MCHDVTDPWNEYEYTFPIPYLLDKCRCTVRTRANQSPVRRMPSDLSSLNWQGSIAPKQAVNVDLRIQARIHQARRPVFGEGARARPEP